MADRSGGDAIGEPSLEAEAAWPRPNLAADAVVLTVREGELLVLAHRRPPHGWEADRLALPGVFLNQDEPPEDAARRALKSKTNFDLDHPLHLVSVENHPFRNDPRGWVVTVLYATVALWSDLFESTEEEERVRLLVVDVPWKDALGDPVRLRSTAGAPVDLAFDHPLLVGKSVAWLRRAAWRSDVPLGLLPDRFTLREAQTIYEAILGTSLFRTTFRRRMVDTLGLIEPTGEVLTSDPRNPELFCRARLDHS